MISSTVKILYSHLVTDNILISYSAGWTVEEMPSVIIISILRIATLMLSETNGNIGLTGKSFSDNSRTFINYSNYQQVPSAPWIP